MKTLKQEVAKIKIDEPQKIPWVVRLFENPQSPIALPGSLSLENHDYLHILLNQDLSPEGEAFVVGFCMGNDPDTQKIHLQIYKFFSRYIYPKHYKFNKKHLIKFDWGFYYGRSLYRYVGFLKKKTINKKAINKLKLFSLEHYTVEGVRDYLGILTSDLDYLEKKYQQQIQAPTKGGRHTHLKKQFGKGLKISSSFCAVVGGFRDRQEIIDPDYDYISILQSHNGNRDDRTE